MTYTGINVGGNDYIVFKARRISGKFRTLSDDPKIPAEDMRDEIRSFEFFVERPPLLKEVILDSWQILHSVDKNKG